MDKLNRIMFNMFRIGVVGLIIVAIWWNFNRGFNDDGTERTFSDVVNQATDVAAEVNPATGLITGKSEIEITDKGTSIEVKIDDEEKVEFQKHGTVAFKTTLEPGTKWDPKLVRPGQVWCKDYSNPFENTRRSVVIVDVKDGWVQTVIYEIYKRSPDDYTRWLTPINSTEIITEIGSIGKRRNYNARNII